MNLGIDLGGTNIRAGINNNGNIVSKKQTTLKNKGSLDDTLSQIIELISSISTPDIQGIGIGVPSVVDVNKGIVFNVQNIPSWKKVELKKILEAKFNLPVFINNDVNCFVLGEHRYGQAKPFQSAIGLAMGTGLGAGIIINNKLHAGNNCGAGEIGELPYLDKNYEFYTSSSFFIAKYNTTAHDAYYAAQDNNTLSINIWKEFGTHIGSLIKAIIYTYDPEAIILGGSIAKAYNYFSESMKEALRDFSYPESIERLKILTSHDENIALLGASSLVNYLQPTSIY